MNHLAQIEARHGRDGLRDLLFIGVAALLLAIAIGTASAPGLGTARAGAWSVTVIDPDTGTELH